MMKVMIVCTNADQAGAPIHVETLVLGLMHKVDYCVVFGEIGPVYERLSASGVKVALIPQMRSSINPYLDLISIIKLLSLIKNFKPNLLHAHSSKAGMLARIGTFITSTPCIYTVHGWGWRGLGYLGSSIVFLIEKILSKISRSKFIYVAKCVANDAHHRLKIPKKKGCVIYNGIRDIGIRVAPERDEFRIIMLARVSSAKDHESLVRAFDSLESNAQLILCGTGTNHQDFLNQLSVWAPHARSRILPLGQRSDVADLLHDCDAFVLTSHFEALPISIIEAMSVGLPIIATNVGGVSELIMDGYSGYLVDRGSVSQIRDALQRLLQREFSSKLGNNARKRYEENFTSNCMLNKTYDIYCHTVKNL